MQTLVVMHATVGFPERSAEANGIRDGWLVGGACLLNMSQE